MPPSLSSVRFPIRRKLYVIIGILFCNLVAVIGIGVFGMWLLSTLRAYVAGEGLWAKAQKNALYSLTKYALSHDESEYRAYEEHLSIPLGDQKARLALMKPEVDHDAFARGWVQGGNHIDDARDTELLFRRFGFISYISQARDIWSEADAVIGELQAAARELHDTVSSGRGTKERVRDHLRKIDEINARLTRLENDFSYTLGEASRWANRTLLRVMLAASLLLGLLGLYASLLISGKIASGIRTVADAAAKVAGGDLGVRVHVEGSDEIAFLAEAFNEMTDGLARLEQMKNDFVSTVSHELRTPLTLNLAPLESALAGDHGEVPEELRGLLEVMHNNSVRLLQMVTGLLDFSKLGAGKLEVKREATDLAALTRGLVDDFRPIARAKRLAVSMDAEAGKSPVLMDRYLYERILFNLLSNAVKFTPEGGAVFVRLRVGPRVALSVRDTGIGISRDDQGRLFQKFRQLETSSSRRFEGTGLGLALVKEFAQLLGGDVAVVSEPGTGTEFKVELEGPAVSAAGPPAVPSEGKRTPVQRYETSGEPREEREGPSAQALPRVVVAEDNHELAVYLKRLLRGLCVVRTARDGEEAFRLVHEARPDLVLSDVMMPRLDGLELCRRLKADPKTASIPVVLLTALTQRDAMTRGWEAGADEYLFKPFHPQEVVSRVKYMLDAQRSRRLAQRDLEAFNQSVAHDLRAPLRKIDGYSRALETRLSGRLLPEEAVFLRKVQDGVGRLDRLIDGLLRLSRVDQHELKRAPVDISGLAAEVGGEIRKEQPDRNVEFHVQPGLAAEADAEFLRIALRSLFENAWKFTSRHPSGRVELGRLEDDQGTVYYVRDDGAGFDMDLAGKLFGPFKRLHTPEDFPGSGIGLATAKRAIERHGGEIWAEAAVERGATFYFTLGHAPRVVTTDG